MSKKNTARTRFLVMLAFLAICAVGFFTKGGLGNACAVGWNTITLVCPLGAILSIVADATAIPQSIVSLVVVLVLCLVLGRAFCSWLCPVHFMANRASRKDNPRPIDQGAKLGRARVFRLDSRHAVLVAAVVSTLLLGFPVFCLVCPVGITFALVLLVMRLFVFGETTWTIILFVAVLVVEAVFLPNWCNKLCPLGALLSLFSIGNRTLRPTVDKSACIEITQGIACGLCKRSCHVGIDLHDLAQGSAVMADCTKCHACADACPKSAISFPLLPVKKAEGEPGSGKPPATVGTAQTASSADRGVAANENVAKEA